MAEWSFYAGENLNISNLSGSGLGFFGADGFGASVTVGEYQSRTFITNAAGTSQGSEVDNIKYVNAASGVVGQTGSGYLLRQIPNYLATLNARFTHSSAVQLSNAKLRIYDRTNINNDPSGVLCKVAEFIHPGITYTNDGSGSTSWQTPTGSSNIMSLTDSPGTSGLSPNGATTSDTQHDFYLGISSSPSSIGSKTFALYISAEYQ